MPTGSTGKVKNTVAGQQGKLEASAMWYKELKEENKRPLQNRMEAERGAGQEKHANRFRQPDVAICSTINSDVSR